MGREIQMLLGPKLREIVTYICETGECDKDVAAKFHITPGTLKVYISHAKSLLGLPKGITRGEMVARYWRDKLTKIEMEVINAA